MPCLWSAPTKLRIRKSPSLGVLVEGVHHHAEEEGVPGQLLVSLVEAAEYGSQDFEGLLPVELVQDVAVAGRDLHGLADGPASLCNDGVEGDVAVESDANRSRRVDLIAGVEGVLAGPRGPARHAPDLRGGREGVVEALYEALGRDAEGVGQQDEAGLRGPRHAHQVFPRLGRRVAVGEVLVLDVERDRRRAGQQRGCDGQAGAVLDLAPRAYDTGGGTADGRRGAETALQQVEEAVLRGRMVGRHEHDCEVGVAVHLLGALDDGILQRRFPGDGRAPLHAAMSPIRRRATLRSRAPRVSC